MTINPVTYILEAIRSLTSNGWDSYFIGRGFLVAIGVGICTITMVMMSFKKTIR